MKKEIPMQIKKAIIKYINSEIAKSKTIVLSLLLSETMGYFAYKFWLYKFIPLGRFFIPALIIIGILVMTCIVQGIYMRLQNQLRQLYNYPISISEVVKVILSN